MKRQDCEQLTLFREASPASRSALPGSEEARRMTVTSGLKCLELYRNSGPLGLLVRMLLGSSIWHSTRCYLTWKTSATPGKVNSNANFKRLQKLWGEAWEITDMCRRPAEPGLGGVVDGVPAWMDRYWVEGPAIPRTTTVKERRADRLKCLGNAVYWRQFYPIFHGIMEVMNHA